ncbi:hypothetical protein BCV70DRAFT_114334 [Testicularia cyperi]|uniref:Uncharacterized protein n=1 Tax=Testicularia cyperi TaxID=1882483 RepID=A0A317XP60_9BASI|nr:hypothetical protein BCV70DRAFT_114334 [Testicularia cyperi]
MLMAACSRPVLQSTLPTKHRTTDIHGSIRPGLPLVAVTWTWLTNACSTSAFTHFSKPSDVVPDYLQSGNDSRQGHTKCG